MKFLVLLSLIFFPLSSFAQITDYSEFEERAVIEISPKIPAPGEPVEAKVSSTHYSDLSRETIVWHINDTEAQREIGGTEFYFNAPESGRTTEVFATIIRRDGSSFAGFTSIRTADVDLIYEANTYTPPFYKGRSLFSPQSSATIAVISNLLDNGVKLSKNQINYSWRVDDQLMPSVSGVGRDSINVTGDILSKDFYVSVVLESLNSNLRAEKEILVRSVNPTVLLYENNPIHGSIFEKALTGTFNFDREEVGITAIPYFFSTNDRTSSSLKYSWFENGQKIGDETFSSFINYRNPERAKSGVSDLSVKIDNINNFLQSGKDSFKINVLGIQQSDTIETTNATSPF